MLIWFNISFGSNFFILNQTFFKLWYYDSVNYGDYKYITFMKFWLWDWKLVASFVLDSNTFLRIISLNIFRFFNASEKSFNHLKVIHYTTKLDLLKILQDYILIIVYITTLIAVFKRILHHYQYVIRYLRY